MREIGIGLIGTGFMGHAHALAFNQAQTAFALPIKLRLQALADSDIGRAKTFASNWGFETATDWESLIRDPAVDLVAITTPNKLHYPMAMAAIEAGKAIYCEKPLAVTLDEAARMRDAARDAGILTRVGF